MAHDEGATGGAGAATVKALGGGAKAGAERLVEGPLGRIGVVGRAAEHKVVHRAG